MVSEVCQRGHPMRAGFDNKRLHIPVRVCGVWLGEIVVLVLVILGRGERSFLGTSIR